MSDLTIKSDVVKQTAELLLSYNNSIRSEVAPMQAAVGKLFGSWEGKAASFAKTKFDLICSSYCDPRYAVLDNFVKFLSDPVSGGYVEVETHNTSLAELLK